MFKILLPIPAASSSGIPPWESRTKPSITSIVSKQTPEQVQAIVGGRNEFKCTSAGDFRFDWRRADGQRLQSNAVSTNGLLVIENVGYKDAGTYECIATDSYGNSKAVASTKLEVVGGYGGNVPPQNSPNYGGLYGGSRGSRGTGGPKITFEPANLDTTVTVGDQLSIRCVVSGAEPMTVNWGVSGRPSSSS
jgi:hypothetical protein